MRRNGSAILSFVQRRTPQAGRRSGFQDEASSTQAGLHRGQLRVLRQRMPVHRNLIPQASLHRDAVEIEVAEFPRLPFSLGDTHSEDGHAEGYGNSTPCSRAPPRVAVQEVEIHHTR